jgi:hypothetical protein
MTISADLNQQIEALLERSDWWRLPPSVHDQLNKILQELYAVGLNKEAARIEALRFGMVRPASLTIGWDLRNPVLEELVQRHAAEMVQNVDNGTKFYLRQMIKEGVAQGMGTSQMVKTIQRDLFGLPMAEARKLPRDRIKSIVNYETNRAMSGAATLLRERLGLRLKQWFTNNVSPCEICLGNQAQGEVSSDFLYEGVFGQILNPPAHPRTCRCVVMAVEREVRGLGTAPIAWPMTPQPAQYLRVPP